MKLSMKIANFVSESCQFSIKKIQNKSSSKHCNRISNLRLKIVDCLQNFCVAMFLFKMQIFSLKIDNFV